MPIFPAEIFGVSEQLGSIEKGKIANLVLASGDLLEKNTRVRHVFVDGKLFEIKAPTAPPAGRNGNARPSGAGLAAGVWKLSISSPMGTREATATLSQDGESVTGTLALGMGSATINSGKLAGSELTLELTMDFGGRTVPGKLTGKIDGNTLTGSMNIMGRDSQVTGTKDPKE